MNYDDDVYITANSHVRGGLTAAGLSWALSATDYFYWQPLTWVSHMLDCSLFGLQAGPHHMVNLVLHLFNAFLLFGLLRRITASNPLAAVAALAWACHPLRVESVAWAAERKDVLAACFWLLAARAYLNAGRSGWRSSLFFALGLAAKPSVVTFPLIGLVFDRWVLGRAGGWLAWVREKWLWWALSAASVAVTLLGKGVSTALEVLGPVPWWTRASHAAVDSVLYVQRSLWPAGLAILYPYDRHLPWWLVAGSVAVLAGLTFAAWRWRERFPTVWTGWAWFAVALLPMSGLVQAGAQAGADRFTYIPGMGLTLALTALAAAWVPPRAARAAALAVLGVLTAAAAMQASTWKSSETVFRRAVEVTPPNWLAERNLAASLAETGRGAEAERHYRASLAILPDQFEVHYRLGSLAAARNWKEALAEFQASVRLRPSYGSAQYGIGLAQMNLGQKAEAEAAFRTAVTCELERAYQAEAHNYLGIIYIQQGDKQRAEAEWRTALQIQPGLANAIRNLEQLRLVP